MVVTYQPGKKIATMTIRGPETRLTPASYDPDQEWFGIQFNIGVAFPQLAAASLVNQAITLPNAADRRFWLHGSSWPIPDIENADQFVQRLVDDGILVLDPIVVAARCGHGTGASERSEQRRFLRTTGLTQTTIRQIDRARHASELFSQGTSKLDTVLHAGYSDQPHLTRSLKRWLGTTPAQHVSTALTR